MHSPDAVLFDFDGTIADSRRPYTSSLNYAFGELGLPTHPPDQLYQYMGPPMHATLADHLGVPAELIDPVVALYRERYAEIGPDETVAYAGIPELLARLHGEVPLAVATSKVITLAEPLLEHMGLRELFDVVAAPGVDTISETKSETIGAALRGLGQPPAGVVMVGDRLYDVLGAAEHQIPTIGVLWGEGSEAELRDAGARWIVSRPDEIPGLLGL